MTQQIRQAVDAFIYFQDEERPAEELVVGDPAHGGAFEVALLKAIRQSFLGKPISGLQMCYWKNTIPVASRTTPEMDKCGVIWLCPRVPCRQHDIVRFIEIVEIVCQSFNFEPNIGLLFPTPRVIDATVALLYARNATRDNEATTCHKALLGALMGEGYMPYRLSTQSMNWLPPSNADRMLGMIKTALDPKHLVSPGRYL